MTKELFTKDCLDHEPVLKYMLISIKWIFVIVFKIAFKVVMYLFGLLYIAFLGVLLGSSGPSQRERSGDCWGNQNGKCPDHILGDPNQAPYWDYH
jgi:hypothetical protein